MIRRETQKQPIIGSLIGLEGSVTDQRAKLKRPPHPSFSIIRRNRQIHRPIPAALSPVVGSLRNAGRRFTAELSSVCVAPSLLKSQAVHHVELRAVED